MKIGIIDADLLDKGTRYPNLALMKISNYYKEKDNSVKLLLDYYNILEPLNSFDLIFLSKVFTFTNIPINLKLHNNIRYGGTGFFLDKAPDLHDKIEHCMPDYHLYDNYIQKEIKRKIKPVKFLNYLHYSIGFSTRGCFRKCDFCINKKYNKVFKHSPIDEFLDLNRKYISLLDDNFLGYKKWYKILDKLEEINKPFQFKQGLDIRLMTKEKAKRLSKVKYKGEFIFAFDFLEEKEIIKKKIKLWKKYNTRIPKFYLLCAYKSQDINDIIEIFERLKILIKYKCLPYIMRYEKYKKSKFEKMYITLARWCNQPAFFKKKSFREYCEANGKNSSIYKSAIKFENNYPDIAKNYFDLRYNT